MHEVLVNRLGGLSLPRKSVVRLTDRPDMTLDVYRGRKTTKQHFPGERECGNHSLTVYIRLVVNLMHAASYFFWCWSKEADVNNVMS